MHCPYCSHKNRSDDLFCAKCGRKMGEKKGSLVIHIDSEAKQTAAFGKAKDIGEATVEESVSAASVTFASAEDFTCRPETKTGLQKAEFPAFAAAADLTCRPEGETSAAKGEKAECAPMQPVVIPVYSGKKSKKEGVTWDFRPKDPTIANPEVESVPEVTVYKPEPPMKPPVPWKKIVAAVLVLLLSVGLGFWVAEWDIFDGSSQSTHSKRDDDDDDRKHNQGGQYPGYSDYYGEDYDGDDYYGDDYYGDDSDDLGYIDCAGCVDGRCSICMGDGDYAGVDCENCDDGICQLCDGSGIIFY